MSGLRRSANLSILFGRAPVSDRPALAARHGYRWVESWWPFAEPDPAAQLIHEFCAGLDRAGVRLVALNLDGGDTAAGDRGLLCVPGAGDRVARNLERVLGILDSTGCRIVNALYGNRDPRHGSEEQAGTALRRLVRVADAVADAVDGVVVVETLNAVDSPAFPLTDIQATARIVRRANQLTGSGNIRLLLDTYHLATMGTDPAAAVREFAGLIGHVQFADYPGRGRPGTGIVDFAAVERSLADVGYQGFVGLEYDPTVGPAGPAASADAAGEPPAEGIA